MEAIAQYGSSDEEQDADHDHIHPSAQAQNINPSTSDRAVNTTTQSRIRSFPHVPGNFAVHVFINVPAPEHCRPPLEDLLQQIQRTFPVDLLDTGIQSLDNTGTVLQAQTSYHVSLSRTLPIRLSMAEPLLTSLRNNLHPIKRFKLRIHPILKVFLNDDKTRTFLALKVSAKPVLAVQLLLSRKMSKAAAGTEAGPDAALTKDPLLQAIDAVSDAFEMEELQRFYDPPRPHISLGWLLGDQSTALSAAVDSISNGHAAKEEDLECESDIGAALNALAKVQWEVEHEVIWCKIGQVKHPIWRNKR